MIERVVLVGAGSASFTRGLVADLIRRGGEVDLRLVDIDPLALDVAERLVTKMVALAGAPIRVRASVDRRDVLLGATAVICTVGVGGRRAWEQDVFVPRKHGIFQPVGDSVMPGGTSRALRMIPAMVAAAEDVLDLCPGAVFVNYGNPMAPVCRAIRKQTGAEVIGLCHGVFDVARYVAEALGVDRSRLGYRSAGMNHLTWFTEVRVDGMDAMPQLLAEAARRVPGDPAPIGLGDGPPCDNPFSWQLTRLFGAFPAVLDRHVVEFFPGLFPGGRYYGKTLGVDVFSMEETIAWGDQGFDEMRAAAESPDPLPSDYLAHAGGEHEQVVDILDSIRQDAGRTYSANLPNRGQVPNLPPEAVIEAPAVADGSGLRPIQGPPLPSGVAGTLATRLQWVETVVEAALEGSRDKVIQALVLDGSVTSLEAAAHLADDLLSAQAEHLPQFAC